MSNSSCTVLWLKWYTLFCQPTWGYCCQRAKQSLHFFTDQKVSSSERRLWIYRVKKNHSSVKHILYNHNYYSEVYEAKRWHSTNRFWTPMVTLSNGDQVFIHDIINLSISGCYGKVTKFVEVSCSTVYCWNIWHLCINWINIVAKAYIIIINHAGATFMEGGEIFPFFAGINLTIILCIPIL